MDSGATVSCIAPRLFEKLKLKSSPIKSQITMADGNQIQNRTQALNVKLQSGAKAVTTNL